MAEDVISVRTTWTTPASPKSQGDGSSGDEQASAAMHLLGILAHERHTVIGGRRNEEDYRHSYAARARCVDYLRAGWQLLE
jgi:hypothetical protein